VIAVFSSWTHRKDLQWRLKLGEERDIELGTHNRAQRADVTCKTATGDAVDSLVSWSIKAGGIRT